MEAEILFFFFLSFYPSLVFMFFLSAYWQLRELSTLLNHLHLLPSKLDLYYFSSLKFSRCSLSWNSYPRFQTCRLFQKPKTSPDVAKAQGLAPTLPGVTLLESSNPPGPFIKGGLSLYLCSPLEEVRQWGRTGGCCHWDISDLPGTDHAREQPLIHGLESPSSQNTLAGAVRRC